MKLWYPSVLVISSLVHGSTSTFAQLGGCEGLLMNGVFNTFSQTTGNYSAAQWHQYWCNGTVEEVVQGNQRSAALDVVVEQIPLGMSYTDAQEFQRVYQSINCGSNSGTTTNIATNVVIQKVASKDILDTYVRCKELETVGLRVNLAPRPDDLKVFVITARFTSAWGTPEGPLVKKVSFMPNDVSAKEGSLQDGVHLKPNETFSLVCQRSTDAPMTVMVETEAGTYYNHLPSFTPPPTDEQLVLAALPRGTILAWFNAKKVPVGWILCDGTNGTPDLSERFPLGTVIADSVGTRTGSDEAQIVLKTGYPSNRYQYSVSGHAGPPPHVPGMDHEHDVNGSVRITPRSTRIMFIMKR